MIIYMHEQLTLNNIRLMVLIELIYLNLSTIIPLCIGCPSHYYGLDCRQRCSGNCISDESCDHVSGVCTNGCEDGYVGTRCANGKKYSFFVDIHAAYW